MYAKDSKFPAFDINDYPGPIKNLLTYDGKLWGIPVAVSAQIAAYRKDLFEQAGLQPPTVNTTWQNVYDYCKQLTTGGNYRRQRRRPRGRGSGSAQHRNNVARLTTQTRP